jgi:hypothetical protein
LTPVCVDGGPDRIGRGSGPTGDVIDDIAQLTCRDVGEQAGHGVHGADVQLGIVWPVDVLVVVSA